MKHILLLTLLLSVTTTQGQSLQKRYASVTIGTGSLMGVSHARTYGLQYGHHLKSGVYLLGGWTHGQGNSLLSSTIGELPPIQDEFSAQLGSGEGVHDKIINSTTLKIGVAKYIQLGSRLHMKGELALARSSIRKRSIGGIPEDLSTLVYIDDLHYVFEQYRRIGAAVGLEAVYFFRDYLSVSIGAEYLTTPSMYGVRMGAVTWF